MTHINQGSLQSSVSTGSDINSGTLMTFNQKEIIVSAYLFINSNIIIIT